MSDKAPSQDLAVLVQGSDTKKFVKDKDGKERQLHPLRLEDVLEFEQYVGTTVLGLDLEEVKLHEIMFILWLSLRQEGKTEAQLDKKEWACTMPQVKKMFPATFWLKASEVFADVLVASGFPFNRPQKAGQEAEEPRGEAPAPLL